MLSNVDRLPTITTPRLRLRWLTPADAPALFTIFGDPVVCRYWSRPTLTDARAAAELQREIEEHFAARTLFQWGIAARDSDRVIGTCTLASLSAAHRRAEIGYALARSVWRKGYVTEALPALLKFAFEELELHRLEADVDPRNEPSIRVLERLGFKREGHMRERYQVNGEIQDAFIYGLLRPEWRALSKRPHA